MSETFRLKHTYPQINKDKSVDQEATFELLYPSLILGNGLNKKLGPKKEASPKSNNPLLCDAQPGRCIHVDEETEEIAGGIIVRKERCPNQADVTGAHGFLCTDHQAELFKVRRTDCESQIIRDIIATDRAAIKAGVKEIVHVTKDCTVTYLT